MANKSKKTGESERRTVSSKTKPAKPSPQAKKKDLDSKKVKLISPLKLTKQHEKKIRKDLEIVTPQVLDLVRSVNTLPVFTARDIIDTQLAPIREFQQSLQTYMSIANEATSMVRMQQELIAQALEPMRQMQESIRQASQIYQDAFKNTLPNFEFLSGLIVDVSFTKTTFRDAPKISRVYDYDELNSTYDLDTNQLRTPLIVTRENETEKAILTETQQINLRFGLFQKEIVEERQKLQEMLRAERADNKVLLAKVEKLEKLVMAIYMDGQKHQVQVAEIKPNTGFTKLIVKMSDGELREVSFGKSKLEVTVLRCLYHEDLDEGELISEIRLNNILREEITTKQMVDAADRINHKVYTATHRKEFIRIVSRQEIQLNPDF